MRPAQARGDVRSAKDFFHPLVQDSPLRAAVLAQRERWLRSVRVEGREELLFEFEMLLRGLERYFHLHNLPLDGDPEPVVTRDFRAELRDVRDALSQSIQIARKLLDPEADHKLVFLRYVESRQRDDRLHRARVEEAPGQDTPQESLFLLRQSFESLRTIIDHLLELDGCSFQLFGQVGNLTLRDIVLNPYFRPLRALEFRVEFDRVKSVPVLEALRKLPHSERRPLAVGFLALFRILHYLSYVRSAEGRGPEARSRVILALVRSETVSLVGYCKSELAQEVPTKKQQGVVLRMARDLSQGVQRIVKKHLTARAPESGAAVDAAAAFTDLMRKQVVALAQVLEVKFGQEDPFSRLVSPSLMAQRLRLDLWMFTQVCRETERALNEGAATARTADEANGAWAVLLRFIGYFHEVSYQLLRYGDCEPFDRFTATMLELERSPDGPVSRARLSEDCRLFALTLDQAFAAVGRRGELGTKKFDPGKAATLLARFRAGSRAR